MVFVRSEAAITKPIAFCVFKYFPYGGLQRDFLRIATACQERGHQIRVYAMSWEGEEPAQFEIIRVPVRGFANHTRYQRYANWVATHLEQHPASCVVGFNKMPGLDVYFAADPCFAEKALATRSAFYRTTARYRLFSRFEGSVFDPGHDTQIILIADAQREQFTRHYRTQEQRFHLVPPGVNRNRSRPTDAADVRAGFRRDSGIGDEELLLLLIGSGFITKGLDRALHAVHSLPQELLQNVRLFVIGEDRPRRFKRLAQSLGIDSRIAFFKGRDDIPRVLQGGDLLLHPAYMESGGIVLLEALVAGLPVIATDVCGFAPHIVRADAGVVIPSPFSQQRLNRELRAALACAERRTAWSQHALAYAEAADIYAMPERAADVIEERMKKFAQ
jgi:UDP-glucose:(heptosyl)LPS alpha-1,3-glucosyltransferase